MTHRSSSPQPNHSRYENEQLDRIGTFGPISQGNKGEGSPKEDAPIFCGPIGSEKKNENKEEEKGLFCGRLGPEMSPPSQREINGPKNSSSQQAEEDKHEEEEQDEGEKGLPQ